MTTPGKAEVLRHHLASDRRADLGTLDTDTDWRLSIGSSVWRLRWNNQIATAVDAVADLHTTCGALLDALAVLESTTPDSAEHLDRSTVNVLVDRHRSATAPTETDEALRSLRDAAVDVTVRLWYHLDDGGWVEDDLPAPSWPKGSTRVRDWVDRLQLPRLRAVPDGLAVHLVAAVADPSLQLYPSEITHTRMNDWALRVDGLQIGVASGMMATLEIGSAGKNGDGPQRKQFVKVFGAATVTVTDDPAVEDAISVDEAAKKIRALIRAFRTADVTGAPITHRASGGAPIVDEHTLEARLLKGLVDLPNSGLVLDDVMVARGSQFPTLWSTSPTVRSRYLDALLRRGRTPLAVELKVATGGQGRYYRRSLIQAVLYAHYIRSADDLEPWFEAAGLDRHDVRACIGIPIPARCTARFRTDLDLLRAVAARVGAVVYALDDRSTPELDDDTDTDGSRTFDVERLSWKLAAALSSRFPEALGRVVEIHDGGGQYDQIQLQARQDQTTSYPSELPRISLNRVGSAWVFNQYGNPRWVWRSIWSYLGNSGDPSAAADTIAAIAGLGAPSATETVRFAAMAARFLEQVDQPGWSWRSAYRGDDVAAWADGFTRYRRTAASGQLPAIARLWGALSSGQCAVVVDQDSLRVWAWTSTGFKEVSDVDPLQRIDAAVTEMVVVGGSGTTQA